MRPKKTKINPNKIIFLVIMGMTIASAFLLINKYYPFHINIGYFIEKTSVSLYIFGIHIHHWIIGIIFLIAGFFIKKSMYRYVVMGIGLLLFFDEIDEIATYLVGFL